MKIQKLTFLSYILLLLFSCTENDKLTSKSQPYTSNDHPRLILTKQGVENIQSQLGKVPVFDNTLAQVQSEVDAEIEKGIRVPIPKDMAGGYTHVQHKINYMILQKSGLLYQILDEEKYAKYVKDVLFAYAELYPDLPLHPQTRSYARGKLFWQCLNDSNWLVYVSQAYDCIYNYLSSDERKVLEEDLFIPFANHLSIHSPQFFNRVHNHSTWGNVAVGMIGLVMDNEELIDRALYGLKVDNIPVDQKDNDGGLIKVEGQKAGYIANLDEPFSPDGYYTEGPYYQRYAMYPFMIFATALENCKPDLKIFEHKDSVLLKAVYALLNLSTTNGEFFPLNDAQKGMSYFSRELVSSVNIAYYYGAKDASLLSIAKKQNIVQLDQTGLAVAVALRDGQEEPFQKKSIELSDGSKGDQGGIGILRNKKLDDEFSLVMKYSAQGLSHGHYDKLSFSLYHNENEVMQDYGLARFVNIEQKNGGGYLKENKSWAKQTIAHNTVIQDETSHFDGKYKFGSKHHSEKYIFNSVDPQFQIVSAKEQNAYPGTQLHRTMVLIEDDIMNCPFVLDIMRVNSSSTHQYDFPYYYRGQIIAANFDYTIPNKLESLGKSKGYQHLWNEGFGTPNGGSSQLTWLSNNNFYSLTTVTDKGDQLIFTRIGANDPEFNLRKDPGFIIRKQNVKDAIFVSTIESHGTYSPVTELAKNGYPFVKQLVILNNDDQYTAIEILNNDNSRSIFILSNEDNSENKSHILKIENDSYQWVGAYYYKNL